MTLRERIQEYLEALDTMHYPETDYGYAYPKALLKAVEALEKIENLDAGGGKILTLYGCESLAKQAKADIEKIIGGEG